jgi:ribosome modulation factor
MVPHYIQCFGARGKKTMTEYEKGYEAAICGKARDTCPFHSSSGEAIAWRSGWNDAIGAELKAIRRKRMK